MYLEIIEVNRIYKIVLGKPNLVMPFEFLNGGVKPDRFAQVKFITYRVKRMKNLMRPGIVGIITDDGIPDHSVIFEFFSP
jgi:hypothetical protein